MFLVYALMDVIKWILDNITVKVIVIIHRQLQLFLTLSLEASVEKTKKTTTFLTIQFKKKRYLKKIKSYKIKETLRNG